MKGNLQGALVLLLTVPIVALALPVRAAETVASTSSAVTDADDQAIYAKQKEDRYLGDSGGRPPGGGSAVVPEPGTVALLGLGLAALGVARRRRQGGKS